MDRPGTLARLRRAPEGVVKGSEQSICTRSGLMLEKEFCALQLLAHCAAMFSAARTDGSVECGMRSGGARE